MCNITRCCTEVCPEHINITDNGIIPLKERVVDRYYDPVAIVGRKLFGIRKRTKTRAEEADKTSDRVTLELKTIARDGIPHALEKAERYRLLNDPAQAESICRDVLAVDADNQDALRALILALTDQFGAQRRGRRGPRGARLRSPQLDRRVRARVLHRHRVRARDARVPRAQERRALGRLRRLPPRDGVVRARRGAAARRQRRRGAALEQLRARDRARAARARGRDERELPLE